MGFAQEIKDFVDSASSTYKLMNDAEYKSAQTKYTQTQEEKTRKEMEDPLNEEMKQAQLADIKSRTAHRGAALALQRDILKQSQADAAARAQAPAGAYQPSGISTSTAAPPAVGGTDNPYEYHAKGGMVGKFADGGFADYSPDDDEEEVTSPGIGAGYQNAPPPQAAPPAIGGGGYDIGAQSRQPVKGGVPVPIARSTAIKALNDGQKYGVSLFGGNGAVPSATRQRGLRAYAQGAGAASPDEMVYLYRKIDPDGTMPESQRNMLAVGALYDYKMKSGDAQGAARAAFQATQYYKTAARNYAALGVAAMQGGQIEPALKLFMKSYANVPDGNDMKLWQGKDGQIGWEVTTPDGKKSGGLVPPDKVMGAAMGIASGAGFDEHLAGLATGGVPGSRGGAIGGRQKKAAATDDTPVGIGSEKGNITPEASAKIREENKEAINAFVDQQNQRNDKTHLFGLVGSKKEVSPDEKNTMTNMLYHLRRNNDVTPEEGIAAIQSYITAPHNEKAGKPTFKLIKDDENDTRTIQFNDGRKISMPTSDYASWATARGEAIKQREDADKKAEEEAAKPKSSIGAAITDYGTEKAAKNAATAAATPGSVGAYGYTPGSYQRPVPPQYDPRYAGAPEPPPPPLRVQHGRMGAIGAPREDEIPPAATPAQGAIPMTRRPYNPRLGQYGEEVP